MTTSTDSMMPMGQANLKAQGAPIGLPPLPPPPKGGAMALPPPPVSTAGIGAPPVAPMPMGAPAPAAPQPQGPPWSVKLQPDGSSIYVIPSPDGNAANDIVLGVNKAPALPKAMQPAAPRQHGQ